MLPLNRRWLVYMPLAHSTLNIIAIVRGHQDRGHIASLFRCDYVPMQVIRAFYDREPPAQR